MRRRDAISGQFYDDSKQEDQDPMGEVDESIARLYQAFRGWKHERRKLLAENARLRAHLERTGLPNG